MSGKRLRIVFMGTAAFAVPALDRLAEAEYEIACVYTQPPRRAGRGKRERKSAVHTRAEALGFRVRAPVSLKSGDAPSDFRAFAADAAVVAAYGLILPAAILEAPRLGCVNIHASLLPRWRGAAPIERAIMAGDAVTGITIMRMDDGLDTGPVLLRRATAIGGDDAGELHDRLASLGAAMIIEALDGLAKRTITACPQPEAGVTYAAKLTAEDEIIDWTDDAVRIARRVRALSPRPGARFMVDGEAWKLLAASLIETAPSAPPGTVLDDRLTIACGAGAIAAHRVQRPGRKPMPADAALRGYAIRRGTRLG